MGRQAGLVQDKLLLTLTYPVVQVAWALMVAHEVPKPVLSTSPAPEACHDHRPEPHHRAGA